MSEADEMAGLATHLYVVGVIDVLTCDKYIAQAEHSQTLYDQFIVKHRDCECRPDKTIACQACISQRRLNEQYVS